MLKSKNKARVLLSLAITMFVLVGMFFAFAIMGSANDEVTPTAEKPEINVWLIGGQSNAVGYANDVTEEQAQDNRYFEGFDNVLYYGYSEKFVPEIEKVAFGQGQGLNKAGAEIGIAEALGDSGTMNIVIKYAQGATYLYPNTTSKYSVNYGTWTPPTYIKNHGIDTAGTKTGLLYTNFLDTVEATCKELDEMGYKPVVRGMWWMQGEAECSNETEASAYAELLETLIKDVRRDVGKITGEDLSNMPFAFGKIYRNPTATQLAHLNTVTACQAQVAAIEGLNAILVDPTDCAGLGQHDSWHFNAATQAFFGTSLVNSTLDILGLSKVDVNGTNVRLSGGGFHKAGDTVTVELTAPNGYTITDVKMIVDGAETSITLTDGKYTFTSEGKDVVFEATTVGFEESTVYGNIPQEFDKENYPFALFTDSFIGAYSYYGAAMEAAKGILYGADGEGKSVTVYMRRDYASGKKDATSEIATHVNGTLNIDLGGNTFTRTSKGYFIDTFAKATDGVLFTSTINTKNGELVYTGSTLIGLNHSADSLLGTSLKKIALGFENVTFTVAEGAPCPSGIGVITSCWENGANGAEFDMNFVNCTFDMTNAPAGAVVLSYSGSGKTLTRVDSNIQGGTVILGSNPVTLISGDNLDKNVYTADLDGNYLTLKVPAGASISGFDDYYSNGVEGELVKFVLTESTAEYDLYALTVFEDTISETTDYGVIPSGYISKADYPFVVFNTDREFVGGYADLGAALNGMKANSKTGDFVILMRRDAEMNTKTNVDGNLWVYTGKATIDLGGYNLSLTDAGNYLFDLSVQNNSSATLTDGYDVRATYTVMNGSITKNGGHSLICMNYGAAFTHSAKFSFYFKNVTFASTTNAKIPGVITNTWENEGKALTSGADPTLITDMVFENCTFDYVNSVAGVVMLPMRANKFENDRVVYNIELRGGKIVSDKSIGAESIFTANDDTNGRADTFTFVIDKDGEYTILELTEGLNAPTALFNNDTLAFNEDKTVDGIVTYKLGEPTEILLPEVTPYGEIPVQYLDKSLYTVALFKIDGTFVGAYSDFGNVTADMISKDPNASYVAYLRADTVRNVKTSSHYKLTGTITVDLNGFTLSNGTNGYMLDIYVGGNGTSGTDVRATYNFKNGTISTAKVLFCVNYGSLTRDMEVYFNFDNVTLMASHSGNVMFQSWENGYVSNSVSLSSGLSQTTFAVFNDCTFDYASSNTGAIFFDATSGSGDISVVNVTINGGKIIAKTASSVNSFIKFNGNANGRADSLRFGLDKNGEYMKLVLPTGETAPTTEIKNLFDSSMYTLYGTDGRDLAFVIVSTGEVTDEYVLVLNCKDENKDHACDVCSFVMSECADDNKDHTCDVCGIEITKCADDNKDHACDVCGTQMTICADDNNDHLCDVCSDVLSECVDKNSDHNCDVCGKELTKCVDENKDHACDICESKTECSDENNDHNCDLCGAEVTKCTDDDNDHSCDICGVVVSECADNNMDHNCDVCGKELTVCVDKDNDHNCDVCGKELTKCADENNDHNCDLCGGAVTKCIDEDKNHNCDICGVVVSECADNNNNHNCDVCGATITECADENGDHKCDICGVVVSECADKNNDHNCDVCGKALTECGDNNSDHNCDICGKALSECKDKNADHNCDMCGKAVTVCEDTNDDHNCELCGKAVTDCKDEDKNHQCDICGSSSACADANADNSCDVCGANMGGAVVEEETETTFFTKIKDWFASIIDKIKEFFASLTGKSSEEE